MPVPRPTATALRPGGESVARFIIDLLFIVDGSGGRDVVGALISML